mgnify:FL=1
MNVAIILGTRPEIIKCSSTIRALQARDDFDFFVVHTNQHYDHNLDAVFFKELELPPVDYNLQVGSLSHGKQTGIMLERIEAVLDQRKPDVVVVQGDTNTVLAGGLAAAKLHIPVAHLEAGLRSFDRRMPEEINRVMVDHISSFLFAPTEGGVKHLASEGLTDGVYNVGNSVVDAVFQHLELAERRTDSLVNQFPEKFLLATVHRDSNTDDQQRLETLLRFLEEVAKKTGYPVIFPAHPRTTNRLQRFGLEGLMKEVSQWVTIMEPIGYLDFLLAQKRAELVITDSGGVQEECCILGTPSVTVRSTTERPETIHDGANLLAPTGPKAVEAVLEMLDKRGQKWRNPFGDGTTGEQVLDVFKRDIGVARERLFAAGRFE